ncbi:allatostatin-A receptor-like [Ptychodera flava]|uniref:allatostatin-A receptor-like n=1 Tax=Ptychodera flava TaxID=63121 RepID=UPI00396AACCD
MNNSSESGTYASFATYTVPPYVYNTQLAMGVIGLIGNFLVILVVWLTPALRTTTNYLIVNLAVADLLTSTLLIVNKYPTQAFNLPVPGGLAGEIYCRLYYNGEFFWVTIRASTFGLLLVTLERYLALVHSLLYSKYCTNRHLVIVVIISWISSVILQMIFAIFHKAGNGYCILFAYPNDTIAIFYAVFYFVVCYLIPTVVMVWAYIMISNSLKIKSQNNLGIHDDRVESIVRARKRLIRMLILVLLAYFICWTPLTLLFFIHSLGGPTDYFAGYFNAIIIIAFANSILNPFIYAFKYRQFRKGLMTKICRCFMRDSRVGHDNTTSTNYVPGASVDRGENNVVHKTEIAVVPVNN